MGKLGIILLLVVVALIWFRLKAAKSTSTSASEPAGSSEQMIQCKRCGVHLPLAEAVEDAHGGRFCSQSHRDSETDSR